MNTETLTLGDLVNRQSVVTHSLRSAFEQYGADEVVVAHYKENAFGKFLSHIEISVKVGA